MKKEMTSVSVIAKIMVHGGVFHADDAMSVALAEIAFPGIEVERVFKVPEGAEEDQSVIVADIGRGRYDHHQPDAKVREDGGKRAACGLLFEEAPIRGIFPTEQAAAAFERNFIVPIEDQDNGGERNPLSCAVSSMNPSWDSEESADAAFRKAVDFLKDIVLREIDRSEAAKRAEDLVSEALQAEEDGVVVLPRFAPWQEVLCQNPEVRFVVFPSNRGGYNLQVIPVEVGSRENRKDLPEEWLEEKPEGCTFVHPGRFLASFGTEAEAVAAAKAIR